MATMSVGIGVVVATLPEAAKVAVVVLYDQAEFIMAPGIIITVVECEVNDYANFLFPLSSFL
jgi:hypothetical protein